jgi:orotate phosphoribosyltransferase
MSDELAALGRDLVDVAVLRGSFVLRSGQTSSYYIDKYRFTTRPRLLKALGVELARRLSTETQRVAGPVLGAVALATAVSLETGLPSVMVRDEAKEYGTAQLIEGLLEPGDRVTVVEDVVTTGGAALQAVHTLRAAGAEVLEVIAVVDREQGGPEAFADAGVAFQALFTSSALGL